MVAELVQQLATALGSDQIRTGKALAQHRACTTCQCGAAWAQVTGSPEHQCCLSSLLQGQKQEASWMHLNMLSRLLHVHLGQLIKQQ